MEREREGWFTGHAPAAVQDFFQACDRNFEANEASARALASKSTSPQELTVGQQAADARERMRLASRGNWGPCEEHLGELGRRFARAGLEFAAWYEISNTFYAAIVPRLIEAFAGEPSRLEGCMLVLGTYQQRSLSTIAREYIATKDQLLGDAELTSGRVLEASLDAVIEMDHRGVITAFNPMAERTFGYSRHQAIGALLADLIIPERDREAHASGLARVVGTREMRIVGRRVELTGMRADRSEFPIELSIIAADRPDGAVRFTGFLRDLTERRRAEDSAALWSHALEQAQFGVVVSDATSQVIRRVNPAYARMLGYEPDELVGMSGYQLLSPRTVAQLAAYSALLQEPGFTTIEVELQHKDGSGVPVLVSTSTIEHVPGTSVRVSTILDMSARDALQRQRGEAQLAVVRTAARLELVSTTAHEFAATSGRSVDLLALVARRLSEIIGDGCAVRLISDDGEWVEPSAAFHHPDPDHSETALRVVGSLRQRVGDGIAGRVAANGTPMLIAELDPAALLDAMSEPFRELLAKLSVHSALAVPLCSKGRTIGVVSLIRTRPGAPYTLEDQQLAHDLADRAGLAIDNAVLVDTLEQRVAERTTALELANMELEAFSYSVSHDLRSPLRAIDGFSQALLADYGDQLDAEGQHLLGRIYAGTQRMASLIEALLGLARISRTPLRVRDIDLSVISTEVVAELVRREPSRVVEIHIAPGLRARGDHQLIRIVLENLIGNAWKFTNRQSRGEVWIGGDAGVFHVRDSGAGFDMAYSGKLFAPFQRLHAATDFEGTGIGLATVHRIIRHHHGRIWAESAPGRGATFYFTLGGAESDLGHVPK